MNRRRFLTGTAAAAATPIVALLPELPAEAAEEAMYSTRWALEISVFSIAEMAKLKAHDSGWERFGIVPLHCYREVMYELREIAGRMGAPLRVTTPSESAWVPLTVMYSADQVVQVDADGRPVRVLKDRTGLLT